MATVRVARPLAAADEQRLTDVLSRQYDTTVHLNVVVDPDVLGGIRVEIGDEVIDGTIASRLDDARRRTRRLTPTPPDTPTPRTSRRDQRVGMR